MLIYSTLVDCGPLHLQIWFALPTITGISIVLVLVKNWVGSITTSQQWQNGFIASKSAAKFMREWEIQSLPHCFLLPVYKFQ